MKLKFVIYLLVSLLVMIGCEDFISSEEKSDAFEDAKLIKSIQESTEKQDINVEDLPSASITVLEKDYYDSYVEDAKMAPRLGYEVGLRKGKGAYKGDLGKTYFNLNGRQLKGNKGSDKDGRGGKDGKGKMECFILVLPVTFIMPDRSVITVENKEDWRQIKNWYEAHPDSKERPAPQYPVEVIMKDGSTVTVNNDEEMRRIHEFCREGKVDDGDIDREKCFEFVYPITHIMPDGSLITITSDDEAGWAKIKAWYEANPDSRERPALQYPVDLTFQDGTTVTVNNDEEMRRVHAQCEEGRGNNGNGPNGGRGNGP